ncbi:MAG: HesA/MoeB/ThiF family protein [Candidatus Lokiarchaeota archaeon]|nr:HesA/MoeB/ThiF family protein [Candidatus Lokiarchaeota archaeon]
MELNNIQIERYSRQIVLKEIGGIGQKKLLKSKITIIGIGGLGSTAAYYLAGAGVGNLKIVDFDFVELSNIHRQILHFTYDIKKKKTESALEKLISLNPDCNIEIIDEKIIADNIEEVIEGSDFVIDGSDNLSTKMLINDACVKLKIPFTIAGALRYHGQVITVVPKENTTCYRCVFGNITEDNNRMSCSQAGVIGAIPGIIGSIEAFEAIKFILNFGDLLTNKMLFIDLLTNQYNYINIFRDNKCPTCGENTEINLKDLDLGNDSKCQ